MERFAKPRRRTWLRHACRARPSALRYGLGRRDRRLRSLLLRSFLKWAAHVMALEPAVRTRELAIDEYGAAAVLCRRVSRDRSGMRRSTNASTVAASRGVKYLQPSGVTCAGGSAEPGIHGNPPLTIAARAVSELNSKQHDRAGAEKPSPIHLRHSLRSGRHPQATSLKHLRRRRVPMPSRNPDAAPGENIRSATSIEASGATCQRGGHSTTCRYDGLRPRPRTEELTRRIARCTSWSART